MIFRSRREPDRTPLIWRKDCGFGVLSDGEGTCVVAESSSHPGTSDDPAFIRRPDEVFNQSPPFEDVDLFTLDRPLAEAVKVNGGAAAGQGTG